ncbi:hypothetical protein COLO4_16424 [Corchorus olitorius]|uniref:Uncharacterized protein n=1 Tax=Corchorus olitorius TaxID=93759 RepID=A0A1R3JHH1_9ROSI|nr:hypothetical protein COLO4_16424 [Corchorus olitorius]
MATRVPIGEENGTIVIKGGDVEVPKVINNGRILNVICGYRANFDSKTTIRDRLGALADIIHRVMMAAAAAAAPASGPAKRGRGHRHGRGRGGWRGRGRT